MPSLYGISFELPPAFRDTTAYVFTSKPGPVLKLPIALEPLSRSDVDAWLTSTREKFASLEDAELGPTRRYENPELEIRGFEAAFGSGKTRMSRLVVAIQVEDRALLVTPKCRPGFEPVVQHLFRSFRRAPEGPPPSLQPLALGDGKLLYRVREFSFESLQYLEPPSSYSFEESGGPGRLYCFRGTQRPELEEPSWSARFGLSAEAVLSSELDGSGVIKGRDNPPLPSPMFTARHWLVNVEDGGLPRKLAYAQAFTEIAPIFFHFVFAREGAGDETLALWKALLTGTQRD
jgi:hypothetical protein